MIVKQRARYYAYCNVLEQLEHSINHWTTTAREDDTEYIKEYRIAKAELCECMLTAVKNKKRRFTNER